MIILAQQLLPYLDGLEHHLFCSEAPVGIWQEKRKYSAGPFFIFILKLMASIFLKKILLPA